MSCRLRLINFATHGRCCCVGALQSPLSHSIVSGLYTVPLAVLRSCRCTSNVNNRNSALATQVPMTLFRTKQSRLDGSAPLLLTAYGAYGECLDEDFRLERLPLLNRGWTLAFAHVRGGGEQGRRCASRARSASVHKRWQNAAGANPCAGRFWGYTNGVSLNAVSNSMIHARAACAAPACMSIRRKQWLMAAAAGYLEDA